MALVKPKGFREERGDDGSSVYTAGITYHKSKEELLLSWQQMAGRNPGDFGFHYDPHNFDSKPEADFYLQMLQTVNVHPAEVQDLYFTGGLHDPEKTDVLVEYKGEAGRWHPDSLDFVIRRGDSRCIIVEIKDARMRQHPVDGENGRQAMAVRRWVGLNPETLRYEMGFTAGESVGWNDVELFKRFIREPGSGAVASRPGEEEG